MSQHSIADARDHLSDLIDQALAGDAVVITREGQPVVEIRAIEPQSAKIDPPPATNGVITKEVLKWLAERRAGHPPMDTLTAIREMRDEGW